MKYVKICEDTEKSYFLMEDASILGCNNNEIEMFMEKQDEKLELSRQLEFDEQRLKKLVVLLTDKCNLRCRYCYLDYGNFEENTMLKNIDVNMLCNIVDEIYEKYEKGIGYIQFFGGEPLIAFDEIKTVILYIEEKCMNKQIALPSYGLVTNGILLTESMMQYFQDKNVSVMISIDGDEDIHNQVRKGINATDTYHLIAENVRKISKKYKLMFELTLNRKHLSNYKKGDAKIWFENMKELGFVAGNVGIIEMSKDKELDLQEDDDPVFEMFEHDMVDFFFEQILEEDTLYNVDVIRVLSRLLRKDISNYSCGAGVSQMTITVSGRIIPCPKYAGMDYDIEQWNNEKIKTVIYNEYKEGCDECWAKNLCIAYCYSLKYRNKNNERFLGGRCWHVKEMNKNVARKIVELKNNGNFDILLNKLKEFKEKIC